MRIKWVNTGQDFKQGQACREHKSDLSEHRERPACLSLLQGPL